MADPEHTGSPAPNPWPFLAGGGEMGARMRAHAWADTPLGPAEGWPQGLRTAVRLMLNTRHPMYIFWGPAGICLYNDAYSLSLGPESHPASLGGSAREVWADIWPIIGPQIEQVMSGRGATWHENHLVPIVRHGRREDVYWTYSYSPIDDDQATGGVGGVLVVCTETTRQVQSERRVAGEAERQRRLLQQMPGFVAVLAGPAHVFQYVNDAYVKMVGPRPLLGRPVREVFPELGGQGFFELLDRVYATGVPFAAEARAIRFAGEPNERYVDFIYDVIRNEAGAVAGIFAAGYEVTERLRVEAALRASEARFRLMADGVEALMWLTSATGELEFVNRAFGEFFGLSLEALRTRDWIACVHPEDRAAHLQKSAAALATQGEFRARVRIRHASGVWRWVSVSGAPRLTETGEFLGHVGLGNDITALIEAQEALVDADRRKDEFLATLSHELRSPLAPIRTAARILATPELAPEKLQWSQRVIQRQVTHMARLLDDLLDLARITRGRLELKTERVRLTSVVDAAVEAVRPNLEAKRHHLRVAVPAEPITIEADPVRLAQVLSNLLANASKYTDAGGEISLRVEIVNGSLCFAVRDTGIGIPPAALGRIFEMFSQVESVAERSEGGLGIGLALVRGLVSLHGGDVEARSGGPGQGSEFLVRLPLGLVANPGESRSDAHGAATAGRRVLIADDNPDAADSLALLLQLAGHEVRVAHGGRAAVTLAQAFRPEVALLDIGMPELNGYEVATQLRQQPWGSSIHLVALTGWGQEEDRRKASAAGFDMHLTKPVDPDALAALLG